MAVKRRSFAQARRAAGYTQESLAEHLGVDRTTVARWESGEYTPQPWVRSRIAEAFVLSLRELSELMDGVDTTGGTAEVPASLVRTEGASLARDGQVPVSTPELDWLSPESVLAEVLADAQVLRARAPLPQVPWDMDWLDVSTAQAILATLARVADEELTEGSSGPLTFPVRVSTTQKIPAKWEDRLCGQLKNIPGEWAHTMNRRKLIQLLGWAASVIAGTPLLEGVHPEEHVRVARAIEEPSRVDAVTIDHIEAILWRCIRQDDALGAQATLDTVLAQRNLVRFVLPECPDTLRPQLLSLYSHHSLQAGWLLYDLNDFDGAGYYFEHARAIAHDAENSELGAFVLCMMSHLATWRGQPRVGIDHAVAAQGWAAQTDEPRLQAYAAGVAARAYAGVELKTLCLRQLEHVERSLARVSDGAAEDSVAHFYSSGQFAGTRSLCLLQLHDTQGALNAAREALATADPAFVRNFAFTHLYLGEAYTAAGGIHEAAAAIGEAAALTARNRSARLAGRVQAARDHVAQCHVPSVVQGLDEQLHAYGLSDHQAVNREP
jgi:DNA-binding XRE family transcriptional regulator/tetratricopeptide (TPR) repeat protein